MPETETHDDTKDPLQDLNASPINPLPGLVWLILLVIAGVEAVFQLAALGIIGGEAGLGWRIEAIQRFAYSSAIQSWMIENHVFPLMHIIRYFSFGVIHGNLLSAVFSMVLIAALGKKVCEARGNFQAFVIALAVPIMAAAIFGLVMQNDPLGWLIGSMTMTFAFVGAFTAVLFEEAGEDKLKKRKAFSLIGILMIARLAFGLVAEMGPSWIAELSAFLIAFVMTYFLLGPVARDRLIKLIRR